MFTSFFSFLSFPSELTLNFHLKRVFTLKPVERIRVCKSIVGKPLIEYRFDDVRTVYDVLRKGKELSSKEIT